MAAVRLMQVRCVEASSWQLEVAGKQRQSEYAADEVSD
jgi:hypothetical protein